MGYVVERSVIYLEETGVRDKALTVSEQSRQFGIVALPATLGDHTGVEARFAGRRTHSNTGCASM